jgi:hypothetical protein
VTRHHCAASLSWARIVAVTKGLPAFEVRCSGALKSWPLTRAKAVMIGAPRRRHARPARSDRHRGRARTRGRFARRLRGDWGCWRLLDFVEIAAPGRAGAGTRRGVGASSDFALAIPRDLGLNPGCRSCYETTISRPRPRPPARAGFRVCGSWVTRPRRRRACLSARQGAHGGGPRAIH